MFLTGETQLKLALTLLIAFVSCPPANAQIATLTAREIDMDRIHVRFGDPEGPTPVYETGFEILDGFAASAFGTILTGQNAYYVPQGGKSADLQAFTYADNALELPLNPRGGQQFVGGAAPGDRLPSKAQRDISFDPNSCEFGFDIVVSHRGGRPADKAIGGVSIEQFSGPQLMVAIATWSDPNLATTWDAEYIWYDAAGQQLQERVPAAAFQNMPADHWYQWGTLVDFLSNRITAVSIMDLSTMEIVVYEPPDRYLSGGQSRVSARPSPMSFRLFLAGSESSGNILGIDNIGFLPPDVTQRMMLMDVQMTACPGAVEVSWSDAPPNVRLELIVGNRAGPSELPSGPCAGTQIFVSGNITLAASMDSGPGHGRIMGNASAGACGKYLELIAVDPDGLVCWKSAPAPVGVQPPASGYCAYRADCILGDYSQFGGNVGPINSGLICVKARAFLSIARTVPFRSVFVCNHFLSCQQRIVGWMDFVVRHRYLGKRYDGWAAVGYKMNLYGCSQAPLLPLNFQYRNNERCTFCP